MRILPCLKRNYTLILILSFYTCISYAAGVTITGADSSYADQEITFFTYGDQISGAEVLLANAVVTPEGIFSMNFTVEQTTFVFAYVGIYKLHLFAEPGGSYEIILPPRKDKTQGELLNPYFAYTIVHLGTKDYNKNELNTQIRMFTDAFLPYYNKHIDAIAHKSDFAELDKDIERMEKPFARAENEFFNSYRKYKYGLLRHLAYQQRTKYISDELFKNQAVRVNNTSYMELFNKVYTRYLRYLSRTEAGSQLGKAIGSHKFDSLRALVATDEVLGTGNLPDLVILKSLHDEFYDDSYSRSTLLTLLDDYLATAKDAEMRKLAQSIRDKVTKLLVGFEPPAFELYDKDSNLVQLDDLKGKYVYLNFCSCFSYTCMNEFRMLSGLNEKHSEYLEIVSIIIDDDPQAITGFLERSQYTWKFLHYAHQSTIIRDYDVRAFPTYYLLDKEGKLIISPAPAPGDEFEARLFKILRGRGDL